MVDVKSEFIGDSLDKVNFDLENSKPVAPARENPDWPETRAKTLDEVENWYWAYGYMFWDKDGSSRDAIRMLRKILYPNGGGDVS
jgi:hypothetical protein